MSDERWEIEVAPCAHEIYEAMILAGKGIIRGRNRAIALFYYIFVGLAAPMGGTLLVWSIAAIIGGRGFSSLPSWTIPVTYVVFAIATVWLVRQVQFMVAQATMRSRFGRSQQVTLDAQGITLVTAHSRWHSGWGDVEVVAGGKLGIAICISGIAISVPRRAFAGPQDADDALAFMQHWHEAAR